MTRKLSLEEVMDRRILVPGQEYLAGYLRTAPEPAGIYEHSRQTSTCAEKIELLNKESGLTWTVDQAVKALYFKSRAGFLCGFITPELGVQIKTHKHCGKQLGPARPLPEYMELGTCTPFIPDWDVSRAAGRVQRLFVHDDVRRARTLADISIGGTGPEAHLRSLWMPYGDMVRLLVREFGTLVSLTRLDYRACSKSYKLHVDGVSAHDR